MIRLKQLLLGAPLYFGLLLCSLHLEASENREQKTAEFAAILSTLRNPLDGSGLLKDAGMETNQFEFDRFSAPQLLHIIAQAISKVWWHVHKLENEAKMLSGQEKSDRERQIAEKKGLLQDLRIEGLAVPSKVMALVSQEEDPQKQEFMKDFFESLLEGNIFLVEARKANVFDPQGNEVHKSLRESLSNITDEASSQRALVALAKIAESGKKGSVIPFTVKDKAGTIKALEGVYRERLAQIRSRLKGKMLSMVQKVQVEAGQPMGITSDTSENLFDEEDDFEIEPNLSDTGASVFDEPLAG